MHYLAPSLLTKVLYLIGLILVCIPFLYRKVVIQKCAVQIGLYTTIFLYLEEHLLPFPLELRVRHPFINTFLEQFYISNHYISYGKSLLFGFLISICLTLIITSPKKVLNMLVISTTLNIGVLSLIFTLNTVWNGIYQRIDIINYICCFVGMAISYFLYPHNKYTQTLQEEVDKKPTPKIKYDF